MELNDIQIEQLLQIKDQLKNYQEKNENYKNTFSSAKIV